MIYDLLSVIFYSNWMLARKMGLSERIQNPLNNQSVENRLLLIIIIKMFEIVKSKRQDAPVALAGL